MLKCGCWLSPEYNNKARGGGVVHKGTLALFKRGKDGGGGGGLRGAGIVQMYNQETKQTAKRSLNSNNGHFQTNCLSTRETQQVDQGSSLGGWRGECVPN